MKSFCIRIALNLTGQFCKIKWDNWVECYEKVFPYNIKIMKARYVIYVWLSEINFSDSIGIVFVYLVNNYSLNNG